MAETIQSVREWKTGVGRVKMIIGGEWADAGNQWLNVENPAHKGTDAGQVPRGGAAEVDRAVQAAAEAFKSWKRMPARERGRAFLKIADALETEKEEFARLYSLETGNAIATQSRGEAMLTADLIRYFGGVASEIKGEVIPLGEQLFSYTRREPLGVVGGIVPWNAPLALSALKISMALIPGNTLVLKPSVEAPLTAVKLVELCNRFLPKGVLNVVTGSGSECGQALIDHPKVAKLSFTGSTEVGRSIMRAAANRIIPVSLELGGKSPQIVFPDANDDATVANVINGMRFVRQGQSCTAGSRLFLHASIFDAFMEKLVAKLKAFKIGEPLDESTQMGAIVNEKQYNTVVGYIADGLKQPGAKTVCGGLPPKTPPFSEGYFVEPTVFTGVNPGWRIAREEVFGPVLVAIPWTEETEVIRMANDSHYGLAAFIYTHDIAKALRAAHEIESGFVQVNQGGGIVPGQSYGGFKTSGIGREWSLEGMLDSFTQRKSVTINLAY
ncbi:MAG: aldehyde dehydrogenase family protein [Desulfobacterales bacterium]|nr:aldehyde dehydrogenase family protein [Desulfobacterales bacterium]MCU0591771.1 aldehyde dehydrogenase family protein [Desulfobacterales bacterium]MCU0602966.1 aldehyde dehydrogenase family protein [Desulfobacterales bacterium]